MEASDLRLVTRFAVEFEWRSIDRVKLEDGALVFPKKLGAKPAVYRFWVETGPGRPEVYIGETGEFDRRMRQYRRGDGTSTSRWVHDHLIQRLSEGAAV